MDDFILKIRLEALRNALDRVRSIFSLVGERRKDIKNLSGTIASFGMQTNNVKTVVDYAVARSQPGYGPGLVDKSILTLLNTIPDEVNKLFSLIAEAEAKIETIQNRHAPLGKVEEMIRESLDGSIETWTYTIDQNLDELKNATPANINGVIEKAWKEYAEIIAQQNRLFKFSEYVDVLGGLALRDAGLDEGVCLIADELMQSCGQIGKTNWNALTIPANQETVTLARSIRMGFPEWTLWAVPLTAHALGQVMILGGKRDLTLSGERNIWENYIFTQVPGRTVKNQRDRRQMLIYLADAFATYAMGPAYACSAILLRFNPLGFSTEVDRDAFDTNRAYLILDMLRKMIRSDPPVKPFYAETVDKLEAAWNKALERRPSVTPLSADEKDRLAKINTFMFEKIARGQSKAFYAGKRLKATYQTLVDNLASNQDMASGLKSGEEGRDVLNAAWQCRIEGEYEFDKIEGRASELWKLIAERKRKREERAPSSEPDYSPKISTVGEKTWPKQNQ